MKWMYSIKNKMMAATLLTIVLALVLINNLSERENSIKINTAISSIYDDRLIAESYIFKYLNNSHQIIEIVDDRSLSKEQKVRLLENRLSKIQELNGGFLQTTLTEIESEDFMNLTNLYAQIEDATRLNQLYRAKQLAKETLGLLEMLSEIQVSEAENQIRAINRLNDSMAIHYYFEAVILIVIAVFIQVLVFSSKTLKKIIPANPSLN